MSGSIFEIAFALALAARVILVGDSTMAPRTGYGDALCARLGPAVECVNLARGGRSTKSYRADGSWERVMALLGDRAAPGTYVLIQFGHNDQPGKAERTTDLDTEFPANLARYVDEVRGAGAHPVLVTPLTRRTFREGKLVEDLVPWADAVRRVGRAKALPVLDLNGESAAAVSRMGPAGADTLALQTQFDHTHLGAKGAAFFARMVSRELEDALPTLPMRPQLSAEQAEQYTYAKVLGGWDPLSDPVAAGAAVTPDYVVDSRGGSGAIATVQAAVRRAAASKRGGRVHILVKPGTYRELVHVPASAPAITIYAEGPDAHAVRIEGNLDATLTGTAGSATAWIQGDGFHAKNVTFANTFNGWSQGVAMLVDDADRVQFENVRFEGFQDTLYLKGSSPAKPPRVFLHNSYVEGDVDFIFGEAVAYFLDTEIRSLGTRPFSYALAPSTHASAPFGFVFKRCAFTHDGTPNALAGRFRLARQWFRGGDVTAVGKVAILESRIGAHIDKARPWADWGIGTPRYRRVQYDSADGEPYLAEYRSVDN